jgi:bis(5'-adenosyl)-triphosphatase
MELWISVKHISENLKKFYNTDSIDIVIQDGEDAGQTVQHVHVHLIPVNKSSKFSQPDNDGRLLLN